jgi:hypothetical protein
MFSSLLESYSIGTKRVMTVLDGGQKWQHDKVTGVLFIQMPDL